MRKLGILLAIMVGIVALWEWRFPSVTVRYRLSLHAEVDGRPASGSGVIEVVYGTRIPWLTNYSGGITIDIRGEAVALDLGERGIMFALLKEGKHDRSGPEYTVPLNFAVSSGGIGTEDFARIRDLGGQRNILLDRLPLLVRFRDLNDPTTAEVVDPLDLAASFGPGARLVRATLEIVSSGTWPFTSLGWPPSLAGVPVTRGIEERLPLMKQLDEERKVFRTHHWADPYRAAYGHFRRGLQ